MTVFTSTFYFTYNALPNTSASLKIEALKIRLALEALAMEPGHSAQIMAMYISVDFDGRCSDSAAGGDTKG